MKTNPIYTIQNSGLEWSNNKLLNIPSNVYSLTISPSTSGTASSDCTIGTENYQTKLYATPSAGCQLSGWNVTGGSVQDNVFTFGNTDATVEPVFEEKVGFQRFMWRFDGIVNGSTFQMGAIRLNDIDLPYTYITYGKGGGVSINSQPASAMVATITGDDPYHKWCVNMWYANKWGWIIFDMPYGIVPKKYELQIAGDTQSYPGRNPVQTRLFASTGTPTTFEDESWELIVDSNMQLPTTNYYWVTVWEDN